MVAISLAVELLIMTSIGFFIKKRNIVQDEFGSQISAFIMNACLPCLVFNSMTSIDLSAEVLRRCGMVLLMSAIVNLILVVFGQIFYIATGKTGSSRLTRYSTIMVHGTFMGVPVIDALFGAEGNMYYAVFMIIPRLLYYGFSKLLLSPPGSAGGNFSAETFKKAFLAPSVVVMPFAVLFAMSGLQMPAPIAHCIVNMSKLCSPLGLILCGAVIAKYDVKKLLRFRYLRTPLIRTVLMPAIIWIVTRPLYSLGMDGIVIPMGIMYSAFPIASLLPTFILKYDPDPEVQFEAASITIIATLVSMITIPFWCFIVQTMV